MQKKILILIFILFSLIRNEVWADCAIQSGPPLELVNYINDIKSELATIKSEASSQNRCNGRAGTFSAERRFLELFDRIDLDGSMIDSIGNLPAEFMLDFYYNVTLSADGQSRGPVTNHGKLFKNLETNSITPALENITAICALDVSLNSGGTPESRIAKIIKDNRKIERYFWTVATGDPTKPGDLEGYSDLLDKIQENYSPEMTSSCKSEYDIEDIAGTIMTKLGEITQGTESGHKAWEDAIRLFQGKDKGTAEYMRLQSRLLQTEMARQGLSQNAKKAILRNLTCPEQRMDPTSSPEDRSKANFECERTYVTGLNTITQPFITLIRNAKTTDEYLQKVLRYSQEKERVSTDMRMFWSNLVKLKSNDDALNVKLLNDLVNIHSELVNTNSVLCEKSQEMYTICMKGQPDVQCPIVSCE